MTDLKALLERADHAVSDVPLPPGGLERLQRRLARKARNRRIAAIVVAIAISLVAFAGLVRTFQDVRPRPADQPKDIFVQVHGWITYRESGGIWAVNPNGHGDPVQLSASNGQPLAWSPDGSTLLIARYFNNGGAALVALHANGSETALGGSPYAGTPYTFSPDGSELLVARKGAGIFTVDLHSGLQRYIEKRFDGYAAAFSPDRTQIAYFYGAGDYSNGLRVMNADGTHDRVLIDRHGLFRRQGWLYYLGWSADGSRLAFQYSTVTKGGSGAGAGVWVIDADGSDLSKVAPGHAPRWSPTRSQLAFASGSGLWVFDVATSELTRISDSGQDPLWSPDGRRIAFLDRGRLYGARAYVVRVDGTHRRNLASAAALGAWNPLPLSASDTEATPTAQGNAAAFVSVDRESTPKAGGTSPVPLVSAIAIGIVSLLVLVWRARRRSSS